MQIADAVRSGRLEAGLIALPINDDGLDVGAAVAEFSVVHATAAPEALDGPITIERLATCSLVLPEARWGDEDPTRRQLAERAQRAGVRLEPAIEIEEVDSALEMAARGLGDTVTARFLTLGPRFPRRLGTVPFADPMYDTFAFVQRRCDPIDGAVSVEDLREWARLVEEVAEEGLRAQAAPPPE